MEDLLHSPFVIAGFTTVLLFYAFSYKPKLAFKKMGYSVSWFPNLFFDIDSVYQAIGKIEDEAKKSKLSVIKKVMLWNMMFYTVGFLVFCYGLVSSTIQSS